MTAENGLNADKALITLVERVERINEEIKAFQGDRKEIFLEAAEAGYDTKVMRQIIKERQQDPQEVDEFDRLLRTYRAALRG